MPGAAALRSRRGRSRRAPRSCGAPPAPTCRGANLTIPLLVYHVPVVTEGGSNAYTRAVTPSSGWHG